MRRRVRRWFGLREPRPEQKLDGLEDARVRCISARPVAGVGDRGHRPGQARLELGNDVDAELLAAAGNIGEGEALVVLVGGVPLAEVEAGLAIKMQLTTSRVESKAGIDRQLVAGVEGDIEAPDDALVMQPCIALADLSTWIGLRSFQIVYPKQHPEIVLDRGKRADGQLPVFLARPCENASSLVDDGRHGGSP